MPDPQPHPVGPGQESVWSYPRPPRLEAVVERVRVEAEGAVLGDSLRAVRVLETSHPPTYYLPPDDVVMTRLVADVAPRTLCEFKGWAVYWGLRLADGTVRTAVAWSYPDPTPGFRALRDHLSFYAGRVDAAWVGDEPVIPQAGDFYGGWITRRIIGPFKGGPGTRLW